jgi:hypothetical protein
LEESDHSSGPDFLDVGPEEENQKSMIQGF